MLHDESIPHIVEKHGIIQKQHWIREWNIGELEWLKRKKGYKGQFKLSNEQLILLDDTIQEENLQTARVKDKIDVNWRKIQY